MKKKILISTVVIISIVTMLYSSIRTLEYERKGVKVLYLERAEPEKILSEEFDCNRIQPVTYRKVEPLTELEGTARKEAFIKIVLPSILIAQEEVIHARKKAEEIFHKIDKGITPSPAEFNFLAELFRKYRTESRSELMSRLNTAPPSIVLAQAAIETGWGRSRFFSEANNVFGIWTFKKTDGIRAISSDARLARYNSILDSVRDYLYNINVGWAYKEFRIKRMNNPPVVELVSSLDNYSVLGDEYVERLNDIIRSNNLAQYDNCRIDPHYFN